MSETATGAQARKERPRACTECGRSKIKCIWPLGSKPGERSCERCSRLKRACQLSEMGIRKKRGPSSRVEQLEDKIDGLLSLLTESRQLLPREPLTDSSDRRDSIAQLSPERTTITTVASELPSTRVQPAAARNVGQGRRLPSIPTTLLTPPADRVEVFPDFSLSVSETENMLQTYKTSHSPLFPFVPISETTSAYDLYVDKPFLLRTIMTVTAPQSAAIQKKAAIWFREYIAEHIVAKQEKSVELLQALLTYIAWGDYHFYEASQVTNLIQLAIALVMDLELYRPPRSTASAAGGLIDEASKARGVHRGRAPHTLEESRALLGCFYVSSMVTALFRRLNQFPYTSYLTTACTTLETAREYESDRFLTAQVGLQRLVLKAYNAFPNPESDASAPAEFNPGLYMTMVSIRNEMESLKKNAPVVITSHYLYSVIFSAALIRLYEPAIYMRPSAGVGEVTKRTEALWCCLEACRLFFEAYESIPTSDVPYLPFTGTSYLSFGIVTVSRLLLLSDSDWDLQLARTHVDLSNIMDRLREHFYEADRCAAANEWSRKRKFVDEGRSTMMVSNDKARWIRTWYMSKLALAASKLVPVEESQSQMTAATADDGAEVPDLDMFDANMWSPGHFDTSFWESLLNEDLFAGALSHTS